MILIFIHTQWVLCIYQMESYRIRWIVQQAIMPHERRVYLFSCLFVRICVLYKYIIYLRSGNSRKYWSVDKIWLKWFVRGWVWVCAAQSNNEWKIPKQSTHACVGIHFDKAVKLFITSFDRLTFNHNIYIHALFAKLIERTTRSHSHFVFPATLSLSFPFCHRQGIVLIEMAVVRRLRLWKSFESSFDMYNAHCTALN